MEYRRCYVVVSVTYCHQSEIIDRLRGPYRFSTETAQPSLAETTGLNCGRRLAPVTIARLADTGPRQSLSSILCCRTNVRKSSLAAAGLTLARQTVYAMARNLAVCVGYVAMRVRWRSACHVVAKVLKCLNNFSKLSRLVTTKLLSADAWHWVSRISRTVRNLCVSEWVVS